MIRLLKSLYLILLHLLPLFSVINSLTTNPYPDSIPVYEPRVDPITKKPVTSGRLVLVGGPVSNLHNINWDEKHRYPVKQFKEVLQCADTEPDLNEYYGALSMLEMIPTTYEIVELMCIWAETRCQPWSVCQKFLPGFRQGKYPANWGMNNFDGFATFRLLRVMNGKLYMDWPFGPDRVYKSSGDMNRLNPHYWLLEMTLAKLSDMPDSVFFFGDERPYLPWNFPFPAMVSAPAYPYNHIPWPFCETYQKELEIYKNVLNENPHGNFTAKMFQDATHQKPWNERTAKAAFFGSYLTIRHLVFDAARLRPDLFDAKFPFPWYSIQPWNPLSTERPISKDDFHKMSASRLQEAAKTMPAGYVTPILINAKESPYIPGHYKYVIVMLGTDAKSTSGRLAHLIAHSGAVVLLEDSQFNHHFDARMRPWVHFVPISYSGADLIEKVEWLKNHDDLAQQIAENARIFGESYLRLEDYYCYATTALETISKLTSKFNATTFNTKNAKLLSGKPTRKLTAEEMLIWD